MVNKQAELLQFDQDHIWHPYTSMTNPLTSYLVESASGCELTLASGEKLIDGMSSWWATIHGYNHPILNKAVIDQTHKMAHVMFGGISHEPAITLCQKLIEITPEPLNRIFLADSGSIAVEVAIKMAIQYWQAKQQVAKTKLLTVRNGYHGDTFAAMSVCDPVNGMHQLFESCLMKNIFAPAPQSRFGEVFDPAELSELSQLFADHHQELAAFIIEPIVQGAGGMRIYHPDYLAACRTLCDKYNVLFIVDEIATGFGRTGKLFACEHANISPDIMCLGKAITGGYMTLSATLCTEHIANTISDGEAGCFMHGPTFMANPLACAVANASLSLLLQGNWQQQVHELEHLLKQHLTPLIAHERVADTRVLGAIGVVECKQAVNVQVIQQHFVKLGVWIRPFGKLIYIMPPYIMSETELLTLIAAINTVLTVDQCFIS